MPKQALERPSYPSMLNRGAHQRWQRLPQQRQLIDLAEQGDRDAALPAAGESLVCDC